MGGGLPDDQQGVGKFWFVVGFSASSRHFTNPLPTDTQRAELEGANPSAEGVDAEEGGDSGDVKRVLDIEDQFRLNKIEGGLDKKSFTSDLKGERGRRSTAAAQKPTRKPGSRADSSL